MKKSILMLLLPLLALASWAQTPPTLASDFTFDGSSHQLITGAASGLPTGYHSSYNGSNYGWGMPVANAGFQYYIQEPGAAAPQNGTTDTDSYGLLTWGTGSYLSSGFYDITASTATTVGSYTVWYRYMRDVNNPYDDYQTSDWMHVGVVTVLPPASGTVSKPYLTTGPVRKTGLVYNGEERELISIDGIQPCPGWSYTDTGIRYVVKETEGMPNAAEISTATTTIPKKKDAGKYYVYYQLVKGGDFTEDGLWTEVGIGGIEIAKRDITEADFKVTFEGPLTYNEADQDLVTGITWTGETRGTVEYIVNDKATDTAPTTGTPVATPQGKDAGNYTVRVVITGDKNHNNYMSAIDYGKVEIAKAKYKVTEPTIGTFTYNGDPQGPLASATSEVVLTGADGTKYYGSSHRIEYRAFTTTENWVVDPDNAHLKRTNAGTYTIKYRTRESTTANANYEPVEGELEFTIDKADWTVKEPGLTPDWEYDAKEYALLDAEVAATGAKTDVGVVKYYINDGEAIEFDAVKAKNAGTYEVWYEVVGTDNYNAVDKKSLGTVTVKKHGLDVAAQSVTVNWTGTPVEAGELIRVDPTDIPTAETETPEALAMALAGFVDGEFKVNDGVNPPTAVTPIPSDAGNYTYVLETKEHQNYKINDFVPNGTLTIVKIPATAATVTVPTDLEYNGTDQELIIVDETTLVGGEMLYFLDEEGAGAPPAGDARWASEIPTGKNAGDYTVFYMVKGDKNHQDVDAVQVDVTIAPKALANTMFDLTTDPDPLVYTGADLIDAVTITAADDDPSILDDETEVTPEKDYELTKIEYNGEVVTKLINAGDYTFTFTGKNNYKETATVTVTIEKKELADDMFILSENVTYNGEAQKPTITTKEGEPIVNADYTIEVKDSEGNLADIDNLVAADTYTFNFIAAAGGNYQGSASQTWTIGQKALDIAMFTLSSYEETYDGTNQMPTYEFADGEPSILATSDFTVATTNSKNEAVTEMKDADTYTFTFTAATDGNYSGEVTANFVIKQATAELTAAEANKLTYNGDDQALVTEAKTDAVGGVVKYQVLNGEEVVVDWTEDFAAVVAKNAGEYTVKTNFIASEVNYTNPNEEKVVTVTILKAEISYTLNNYTKDWDGEAFDEIEDLFAVNNGELFGDDKYDRPFDFVLNEQYKDAGDYDFTTAFKVVYKEGYPENYDVKVTGTAKITINKVDIVATDYTVPTAKEDLTYINSTAQDLVNAGEVITTYLFDGAEEATPIGTFMYFVGEKAPAVPATEEEWAASEWSTEVPQGTDAGNYTIWYMVKGDKNHNNTEPVSIPNSIAANASGFQLAFADDTWTYDGVEFYPEDANAYDGDPEAEKPVVAAAGTDYDFTLTKDGEAFEGKLVDAGTYVFTYTGKGNYEGSSAEATIVIEPKELEDAMVELTAKTAEYNTADQKPEYTLTYTPEGKPALTLAEDKDFTVEAEAEMVTGGEYVFTFTGIGNYTGTATATFTITKRKVIAQAEDCAKNYDGYYGLAIDGGTVEVPITWGGLVEGEAEENIPVAGPGAITVDPYSQNVGKYAIIVDGSKFTSDNYEVIKGDREAWFTIKPVDLTVKWGDKMAEKIYGTADPALASYLVIDGAVGAEVEDIRANTVITRAKGETVGTYGVELSAKAGAKVFGNYNVTFEGADEAFKIKKAHLIASLAPQTVTYTGVKAKLYDEGETLPFDQLVVNGLISDAGLGIDDYKDVVSNITVNIPDDAINVGDYEITLATAEAANYEFEFLPATLTIEPLDISKAVVTIPEQQVRVGDVAADVIDAENFTIEFEGFYADDAAAFKVAAADRFVDGDGKIKNADKHETGLVLVAADAEIANNYTGWEADAFTGNLVVVGGETILLDDTKDIATTAKTGVDVTFTSRNILQDNWNVLCLPFAVTVSDISDAFGYAAVDILNEAPEDGNMHFKVVSSGTIKAGTPFIVKPTSDEASGAKSNFNQITFFGVNVEAFSGNPEPVKDNSGNKFCGTFMAETTFYGDAFWFMSKGMWKQASNYTEAKPVKLGAYRGYIELASADARIFIEEPDGTITAIDGLQLNNNEANAEGWYTVNGMKLDAAPTQKGTYINNGKKVIVK